MNQAGARPCLMSGAARGFIRLTDLSQQDQAWAERIAAKCARGLPACFTLDDLRQAAVIAAWQALQVWDASKGVPFQGFAYLRVRGACYALTRRRAWTEEHHEQIPEHVIAPRDRMLDEIEAEQLRDLVKRNIAWVPYPARTLLELHYLRGWRMSSIGRMFHMANTTVNKLRRAGLGRIRERIKI